MLDILFSLTLQDLGMAGAGGGHLSGAQCPCMPASEGHLERVRTRSYSLRKDFLDVTCYTPSHKAPYDEKVATVSSRGVCASSPLLGIWYNL